MAYPVLMVAQVPLSQWSQAGLLRPVTTGQPFWAQDYQVAMLEAAGQAVLAPPGTIPPTPEPDYTVNMVPGLGVAASNCSPGPYAVGMSVTSVFGRAGAVVAQAGDYNAAQVGADPAGAAAAAAAASLPVSGGTMTGPIAMGGSKITGAGNGVAAADVATIGQVPPPGAMGGVTVAGLGLGLLTFMPNLASTVATLNDGTVLWALVTAQVSMNITHLGAWLSRAGVTPGAGVNRLALYSELATSALLTSTGDMTSQFETTGTWAEAPCTSQAIVAGTNYYLSIITSFTGTTPQIYMTGGNNVPPINGHYPWLFQNGQSTIPATFTPSSAGNSFANPALYAR